MPETTNRLDDLTVNRISLLLDPKQPANRRAILVAKSADPVAAAADGGQHMPDPTKIELNATAAMAEVLRTAVAAEVPEAAGKLDEALAGFDPGHRDAVRAMAKIMAKVKGAMRPELLSMVADLLGLPKTAPAQASVQQAAPDYSVPVYKAGSTAEFDLASVPEALRPAIAVAWKECVERQALEKQVADLRKQARRSELLVVVQKDMGRAGKPDEIAELLLAVEGHDRALADKVGAVLKGASALAEQAFHEVGQGDGTRAAGEDRVAQTEAYGKIISLARERVSKSIAPLSLELAIVDVIATPEGAALQQAHTRELRGQA